MEGAYSGARGPDVASEHHVPSRVVSGHRRLGLVAVLLPAPVLKLDARALAVRLKPDLDLARAAGVDEPLEQEAVRRLEHEHAPPVALLSRRRPLVEAAALARLEDDALGRGPVDGVRRERPP